MTGIQIILLIAAVMGGIFVFVPLLAHWYGFRGIKRKTVGDGQHGTARWAEKKEIGQVYTRLPFEPEKWRADPDSRPAAQGIVVGCETHNGRTVALVDTGDVHCLMIGASGAVFGILLAFGMLFPNVPLYLFFIPVPIKAKYMVIGYGLLELFFGISGAVSGVAHFAHLGGLLVGLIIILIWKKKGIVGGGYF